MLPFANYHIPSPPPTTGNSRNNKRKKKKKKRPAGDGSGGGGDELAAVKAAAWAWYQRNEGKPIVREFDLPRAPRTPQPSRYKLEAAKNVILSENKILAENRVSGSSSLWYTESLLYDRDYDHHGGEQYSHHFDAFEIESISKRIVENSDSCPLNPINVFQYHRNRDCDEKKVIINKRKLWKARMIFFGPKMVCGRRDDVDSHAYALVRRRQGNTTGAAEPAVDGKARTGND